MMAVYPKLTSKGVHRFIFDVLNAMQMPRKYPLYIWEFRRVGSSGLILPKFVPIYPKLKMDKDSQYNAGLVILALQSTQLFYV